MTLASTRITRRDEPPLPSTAPVTSSATSQPSPADAAFRSLLKTLGLLKRLMEPYFVRFGVSSSQWAVLAALHRGECEEGRAALRLTDLGDRLIVRPPSVTGVVDRLQRMGLVARTASSDDHRAKNVRLTPAGRDLVARILEHHPAQVRLAFQGLTGAEQGEFQRLLDRLSSHLEGGVSEPTSTGNERQDAKMPRKTNNKQT